MSWQNSSVVTTLRMATEQAIVKLLELDPVTAHRFGELSGKVLAIESTLPSLTVFVAFYDQGLELLGHYEETPDCSLRGPAHQLLKIALSDDPASQLHNDGIVLSGNIDLLLAISEIMRNSDFDWEGELARHTGGIAAHMLGNGFRQGLNFARKTSSTFQDNIGEYLQEELRVLPPKTEVVDFFDDLDDLKLATDRLAARTDRLETTVDAQNQQGGQ